MFFSTPLAIISLWFTSPFVAALPRSATDACCLKQEMTNYPGNDISTTQIEDVDACAERCAETVECKFWTFQHVGDTNWCYLKETDNFIHKDILGFTSGNKACGQGKEDCSDNTGTTEATTAATTKPTTAATTKPTTATPPQSDCECTDVTKVDHRDRIIGQCLTKVGGKFWCYVAADSKCEDKKESKREAGLNWSHKACDTYDESQPNRG